MSSRLLAARREVWNVVGYATFRSKSAALWRKASEVDEPFLQDDDFGETSYEEQRKVSNINLAKTILIMPVLHST